MPSRRSPLAFVFMLFALATSAPWSHPAFADNPPDKAKKDGVPTALPPSPARLWVSAPSADEPWTVRIDNLGDEPIRIPADIRLLTFDIDSHKKNEKPVHCAAPPGLRPETFPDKRALFLAPGQSYIEAFDWRLFCFGKAAGSVSGGNVVHTRFGWDEPRRGSKKAAAPPFAVQGTVFPPRTVPLRGIDAPAMIPAYGPLQPLIADDAGNAAPAKSAEPTKADTTTAPPTGADAKAAPPQAVEAAKGDTGKNDEGAAPNPPIVDENAPRLELTSEPFSDASAARDVKVAVTVKNVGHRPILVAIQPRNFAFRVHGPDGNMICDHFPATHAVPRDFFRKLRPDDSASFTVLLDEQCPRLEFDRPGLYTITPILHAVENGSELNLSAWTGVVSAKEPTLLRLATGRLPFYRTAPVAVPTPAPSAAGDDADTN